MIKEINLLFRIIVIIKEKIFLQFHQILKKMILLMYKCIFNTIYLTVLLRYNHFLLKENKEIKKKKILITNQKILILIKYKIVVE